MVAEVGEHGGDHGNQYTKAKTADRQGAMGTLPKKKTHGTNQADRLLGVLKRDYASGRKKSLKNKRVSKW